MLVLILFKMCYIINAFLTYNSISYKQFLYINNTYVI